MIDAAGLVHALGDAESALADWVLIERDQELATAGDKLRRAERRTRWLLTVHVDVTAGRGSATVAIDAVAGDPEVIVEQAVALARVSVGPAWRSIPPAAAARVALEDPAIAGRDPLEIAEAIVRGVHPPAGATVTASATVLREHVTAITHQGFHMTWGATLVRATALVAAAERSLEVARDVRRASDLDLDAAIAGAATDLELLAKADAPAVGPCSVVLAADAMLHGGLGVWTVFETQADAALARQGLTRFRERAPIAPGAERIVEPLTILSDGALAYGLRSAPLADGGDAVRRFPLVERGLAAGLGMSPREAGLRHREPNGGVRNLVVQPGSWSGETTGRAIEVRRLRDLAVDPYTGDASLDIALALDGKRPFTGGVLQLDLFEALAHARRSANRIRRGAYEGPAALWIERAELLS